MADTLYYEIFYILVNDVGLSNGMFGYYFVHLLSTLMCVCLVLVPFIIVYFIIKRLLT